MYGMNFIVKGKVRCPQSMARRIHASKSASRQQCSHRRGEAGDVRVNSVNSPLVVSRKGEKGKNSSVSMFTSRPGFLNDVFRNLCLLVRHLNVANFERFSCLKAIFEMRG